MKKYIGVKMILAKAMTKLEYNTYRGWDMPSDEDPNEEGFLVEYVDSPNSNHPEHKGYISWSPKSVFEEAYKQTDGMTFGLAIEALKKGMKVARSGWNGKGMFVFMRPADDISADVVINHVKSLPKSVKDYYIGQFSHTAQEEYDGEGPKNVSIHFSEYLCMKAADGSIVNGWLASQPDMLSEDWMIVE